jgi:hypothetical protein
VLFNSLTFIVFFAVVLALHYAPLAVAHQESETSGGALRVLS